MPAMRVALDASTGVRVQVWRENQLFHATRENAVQTPQICLGVDLFEVVAELAGLDLERPTAAEEASTLATEAQRRLASAASADEVPEPKVEAPAAQAEPGFEQAT